MSGQFSKNSRPALAGEYFNWSAQRALSVEPSTGSIVVVPATGNWGPVNSPTLLNAFEDQTALFGSKDSPLQRGVYGAFKGEGRAGHGGAGAVLAVRMATSDAAVATKVLNNVAGSPAVFLTFTAKYKGTRGNDYRFTVQAGTTGGTKDLIILDGTLVLATYTFSETDAAAAAALVNADPNSPFTAAAGVGTGTAIANISASAATGGLDGDTLTGTEWANLFTQLDSQRWSIFAAYGLTDSTIRASLVAWIKTRNERGQRAMAVMGGGDAEAFTTANTRSTTANSWNIVNIGGPSLRLDDLAVNATTAEFAVRVAGAIANRGLRGDLIYARFAGVSQIDGTSLATQAQQETARSSGTTVFCRDNRSAEDGPIFIRDGVTTYADDSQSPLDEGVKMKPVALYRVIKNIRIQQYIELTISEWATSGDILGMLPVNDKTRALVKGFITQLYTALEQQEVVSPGWVVELDTAPPPTDLQDFIQYAHAFSPTRALRQLYNTARIA